MKTLKKTLCLVLSVVMLVGVLVIPANAANKVDELDGADEISESTETAVAAMVELGIMSGDENGLRPKDTLTRAEGAALIARAMATPKVAAQLTGSTSFTDVPEWCAGVVSFCYQAGVALGDDVGLFNPDDTLKAVDFAAMLLRAAGVEGDFTGVGYENRVIIAAANSSPVLTDGTTKDFALNNAITRENAAQLLFNAMQIGETVTTTEKIYKIVLKVTTTVVAADAGTTLDELLDEDYETLKDALTAAAKLRKTGGTDAAVIDVDYVIIDGDAKVESAPDSLGYKVFGMQKKSSGKDAFGRTTSVWNFSKADASIALDAEKPAVIFTSKIQASDLKDYKIASTVEVITDGTTDGTSAASINNATDQDAAKAQTAKKNAIVGLSDYTRTLELYTNRDGDVSKIIMINYYTAKVDNVANDGTVTFAPNTSGVVYKSSTLEKGKVVWFTIGKNANGDKAIQQIEYLEPVAGKLTSISNDTYSVNNDAYPLATVQGNMLAGTTGKALKAADNFSTEKNYYVRNNAIVGFAAIDTGAAPVYDKYAIILKANVVTANDATWLTTGNTTCTAQVQVLTSEGEIEVYDVAVLKNTGDAIKVSTSGTRVPVEIKTGDFYVAGDNFKIKVTGAANGNASDNGILASKSADGMGDYVYSYSLSADGKTIIFHDEIAKVAASAETGVYFDSVQANHSITNTSATVEFTGNVKAVVNSDTTFLFYKDGKVTAVKGAAALGTNNTISNSNGKHVVIAATKANNVTTYVVKYVFVTGKMSTPMLDVNTDKVYVSGNSYSVVPTSDGKWIFTYDAINVNGETIQLTKEEDTATSTVEEGIYSYTSGGKLGTKESGAKKGTATVAGNVIIVDDLGVTFTDSVVVGGPVESGKTVYILANTTSNTAIIIFVLD